VDVWWLDEMLDAIRRELETNREDPPTPEGERAMDVESLISF
jgi:hypothetical protein